MTTWLNDLKPGDVVGVSSGFIKQHRRRTTVERVTKALVVVVDGTRYWKKNGRRVGDGGLYTSHLCQWTREFSRTVKA